MRAIVFNNQEAFVVEREEMDWDLYGKAVRELAQTIADDDYQPDIILAIVRG